jgi:two-component system LytT family response regulator
MFPSKDGYQLEKINEIIYCKADGAFSSIYTLNEKPFITTASLKNLEELLPPEIFFRIHKSYLINLNHVKKYDKKNTKIFLENNYELDVAVRRANEFLRLLTIK